MLLNNCETSKPHPKGSGYRVEDAKGLGSQGLWDFRAVRLEDFGSQGLWLWLHLRPAEGRVETEASRFEKLPSPATMGFRV